MNNREVVVQYNYLYFCKIKFMSFYSLIFLNTPHEGLVISLVINLFLFEAVLNNKRKFKLDKSEILSIISTAT